MQPLLKVCKCSTLHFHYFRCFAEYACGGAAETSVSLAGWNGSVLRVEVVMKDYEDQRDMSLTMCRIEYSWTMYSTNLTCNLTCKEQAYLDVSCVINDHANGMTVTISFPGYHNSSFFSLNSKSMKH